ncbi:ran-binding protein M isoform X2 [Musca autumnalis]|uniref:ran-binding protein M isoform X2 n=1 Tax=Musca autumnalis TaxID=221902 RepID=UPI003CE9EFD0
MDAENDNDQPNSSSASASVTPSSSNNSSSSNLLGNLPMLPFMRSTDDDDVNDDDGNAAAIGVGDRINDNVDDDGMHEEPMPLQQPPQQSSSSSVASTLESGVAVDNNMPMAPNANANSGGGIALGEEPMQQEQSHQASPPPPPLQALQQPPSNLETFSPSTSTRDRSPQPQRNDIADTLDASAVVVQPLGTNAAHQGSPPNRLEEGDQNNQPPPPAPAAAVEFDNDIHLDDNDNNDFDIDLNAQNESLAANAGNATTSNQQQQQHSRHQSPTTHQQESLDISPSGSAGTSGQQPPTTLPLLLYQQPQQQQQTEESKHLPPSYDHRYHHNPRSYHHHHHQNQPHSSSSGSATGYPYEFGSIKNSNGTNNNSTMFAQTSSSSNNAERNGSTDNGGATNGGGSTEPVVDRLKMLYPNVNENETPLPRCWSPHDKCLSIGLSQNNLRVHFKGKQNNDAASVRTAHPIPPACGIYYFEVKIISKGKNGYMGIGLTAQQFRMNRLPGWDKQSYGYHGDDGNSFSSSGHGQSYGPTFTTGDIIGCCVNFVNNTCFYTKNGTHLGIAFRDLPTKLYPTVGLQTPGEEVDANFGQEPFKFDKIEEMMRDMREEMKKTIYDFPLPVEQGDPTTLLQKMVNSYLVHNGYSQTAEAFARTTGQTLREDLSSMRNRQKILKLVMSGRMGQAIEQTLRSYPGLLENNKNLWFMLKCRQFIEMINGSDIEYCPSSSTNKSITTNDNTTTTTCKQTTCSASNQTSVIQSTKSYQNGNTNDDTSSAAVASTSTSSSTNPNTTNSSNTSKSNNTTNNSSGSSNNCSSSSSTNGSTTNTIATTTANNTNSTSATTAAAATGNNSSSNNAEPTTATNNAQNTSHTTVIQTDNDIKTESTLVEHCSASGDAPNTISKNNNDNDYLNDVEMDNNGHTTNGNICKNGNTNNFNESIDADEEMDVDVSPSVRKYSHGIERILEFGKDLSQMGQQLEKESKMTDEERQMLEDAFSLIAYSNPWASPLGWQLCPTKRETVCRALNSAILESMNYAKWPPLEYCVAHANELLKVMAQASLGACAFVNISDVFPKN